MKGAINYIREVFGDTPVFTEILKEQTNVLPFYITKEYTFWEGNLLDRNIVFAKKLTPEHFTPDQYKKQQELLERNFDKVVVFVLSDLETYNRNRLIQKRINFVIGNKQIFIPGLAFDIKEYALKPQRKEYLQPAAQCLILFHLQKEELNQCNYKQLAAKLNYPYLTISRAVENLKTLGLCKVEGSKEKTVYFEFEKKELWEKAFESMRNPVVKNIFIDDEITNEILFKSNINALAHYTDLNDDKQLHFAIHQDLFRKLHKEGKIKRYSDYDGKYSIETWKYPPAILANNEYVDPLSLYLTLKEDNDERVQMALEQILENKGW
ncbi:MAG: hypothetical protein K9H64_10780 [Bacteroidales bacterium]|nr:hypothetical protein [Bacteroidales bacterium]MCF8456417.1 hypothetical protein [Bacteroidales bacterium]